VLELCKQYIRYFHYNINKSFTNGEIDWLDFSFIGLSTAVKVERLELK